VLVLVAEMAALHACVALVDGIILNTADVQHRIRLDIDIDIDGTPRMTKTTERTPCLDSHG
jgi:hypothetical protein